jgi:hypothetical protein
MSATGSQLTFLCYSEYVIKPEVRVQLSDPLGPMSYCTSTQKMIQSIKTNCRQWYLDDGTLGGRMTVSMRPIQGFGLGWRMTVHMGAYAVTYVQRQCTVYTHRRKLVHDIVLRALPHDISTRYPIQSTITSTFSLCLS